MGNSVCRGDKGQGPRDRMTVAKIEKRKKLFCLFEDQNWQSSSFELRSMGFNVCLKIELRETLGFKQLIFKNRSL